LPALAFASAQGYQTCEYIAYWEREDNKIIRFWVLQANEFNKNAIGNSWVYGSRNDEWVSL